MRKIRKLWRRELLRPTLYRSVTKLAVALTLVLLWKRFAGRNGTLAALGDGFFIAGVVLLALAWFSYLRLDGVDPPRIETHEKPRKKRHWSADIADFTDEHIIAWDELEDRERSLCALLSSALCALVLLLAGLVLAFLPR